MKKMMMMVVGAAVIAATATVFSYVGDPEAGSKRAGVEPVAHAQRSPVADGPPGGKKWSTYFPDVTLTTHEGKKVRFYEDLLKGKTVIINFMYSTCNGT